MAKSVAKVTKQISKKKGSTNALHVNSRDSQRIRKAQARDSRLQKSSALRAKSHQPLRESILIS